MLGVGLGFEFPLLLVLLIHLGIMSTAFLRKYRRHAIVVIFIVSAVILGAIQAVIIFWFLVNRDAFE